VSSHREAPEISKDPVADNTDVYAFMSPDDGSTKTVTIITNYIPGEAPAGGPNFYEFGDDVLYSIFIDNNGDAKPDITYQFQFTTQVQNPDTFLYNTGQIKSLTDSNWNRRQVYSVTRIDKNGSTVLGQNLPCPPCNVGPRSIPDYNSLANASVNSLSSGETVFAGQRNDGFFVDLGAIFDLADLRPFQNLHLIPSAATASVDTLATLNVHSIAIKVPVSMLTKDGSVPKTTDLFSATSVLGIWAGAARRKIRMTDGPNQAGTGPWVQVSRLGNPLFNEVVVPMGDKDEWNASDPVDDSDFLKYVQHPELAGLLPVLYPNVFPKLDALNKKGAVRADLVAILMTGIPKGVVKDSGGHDIFQNFTGSTPADMLRLNVAIPPTTSNPNPLGILGGDLAGFPNGRRVFDDIVTVELRAFAGATYPLVASYTPDAAAGAISENLNPTAVPNRYQPTFPYLGPPHDGFDTPSP
jgi:Domain of unknown function (DUF4331)